MREGKNPAGPESQAAFLAAADEFRPALHRYCARMMGSIIDGEDIVQDALERAVVEFQRLDELPVMRPWLFRIAHNRALDVLRGQRVRWAEPIDSATAIVDVAEIDPAEARMHDEAIAISIIRFAELPVLQRSVVVLKDVLDESLLEIAALLGLTLDAVKGHLARGRARFRALSAQGEPPATAHRPSVAVARYAALFNARDWDGLRALLADDVKLRQSAHPLRSGRADVGLFFTIYANSDPVWLVPAWLDGREVLAVFDHRADAAPAYPMWLDWRDDRIVFIRDYRHIRHVVEGADFVLESGYANDVNTDNC